MPDAFPYEDIVSLPHPVSRRHPQMTRLDRAAQFAPFAALVGYEDSLAETGRFTEERRTMEDHTQELLDRQLRMLQAMQDTHPLITLEYFVPDTQKNGGHYVTLQGKLAALSPQERKIYLTDGRTIPLDDLWSVSIEH